MKPSTQLAIWCFGLSICIALLIVGLFIFFLNCHSVISFACIASSFIGSFASVTGFVKRKYIIDSYVEYGRPFYETALKMDEVFAAVQEYGMQEAKTLLEDLAKKRIKQEIDKRKDKM